MAPDANTMALLSGIEPHSSLLAKQFYQLEEPMHGLITELSFGRDGKMLLADLICHSQTPPMWLEKGGFLFHMIQSVF